MDKWGFPSVILGIVGVIFGFFWWLGEESESGLLLDELGNCKNLEEVKTFFDANKGKLGTLSDSVREKIRSFGLPDEVTNACTSWMPPAPMSLNLVVVPDLSKRILDDTNNPDQVKRDMALLNHIFETFKKRVGLRMNTKDRLIVDVTDREQAGGMFGMLADSMNIDLSEHKGEINRLYFEKTVRGRFAESVNRLYAMGKESTSGADYVLYFRRDLSANIRNSTLFDRYRNVLIIITDGYLEAEHTLYTGSWETRNSVASKRKKGHKDDATVLDRIRVPDVDATFPMLEVLVVEVNERTKRSPQEPNDPGTPEDFEILRIWWKEWLKQLEIKNVKEDFFIPRKNGEKKNKEYIDKFLNK